MDRPSTLAGALVCLLVTAGCLGVLGGGSTPGPGVSTPGVLNPTTTSVQGPSAGPAAASTAGTPTVSPTRAAISLPSGMSEARSGPPKQLVVTHDATLQNTSFTARYTYVTSVSGATQSRTLGILQYDGDEAVYYNFTTWRPGSDDVRRIVVWSNGSTARHAITSGNETVVEDSRPRESVRTYAGRLSVYLRAFETEATGYSRFGDDRTVRISGLGFDRTGERDAVKSLAFRLGYNRLSGGTFSAAVTRGVIGHYRVELNPTSAITIIEELEITRLGSTTVRRPDLTAATNGTRSE